MIVYLPLRTIASTRNFAFFVNAGRNPIDEVLARQAFCALPERWNKIVQVSEKSG